MGWFGSGSTLMPANNPNAPGPHSRNPFNAPTTGKAVARGTALNPPPDPTMTLAANSDAMLAAQEAATRQRRRATGGSTLLTGNPSGPGINPPAGGAPRALVGTP